MKLIFRSLPLAFCLPLSAAIVANDTFDVAGSTGVDDGATDPLDLGWTASNDGTLTVGNRPAFGGSNAMKNQGGAPYRRNQADLLSTVSLANVGESIFLSLDLETNNAAGLPDAQQGYSLGLSDGTNGGYFFWIASGTSGGLTIVKDDGSGPFANGAGEMNLATGGTGSINTNATAYTLTLGLTRTVNGIMIDADFEGLSNITFEDTSGIFTEFSTIHNGTGNHSIDWYVDNAVVNVVPEPSAVGLLGLGILAGLARRRR